MSTKASSAKAAQITFLIGAGASVPAGVPHVRRFYQDFSGYLVRQFGAHHELVLCLQSLEIAWEEQAGAPLGDLERLYEALTFLSSGQVTSIPISLPKGFPVRSREIELLEWELKKYVQQRCLAVRQADLDYLQPIAKFTKISRPLVIISLNYDPCIELVMQRAGVPWTDGAPSVDKEFFGTQLNFSRDAAVHLVKLHGSATWYQTRLETEPGWMRRVQSFSQVGVSRKLGMARTLTHEAMMIYPTLNKALTNGPFPALALKAQSALAESKLCIAVGYSFGDVHVRRLVLEALSLNPDLKLIVVNPDVKETLRTLYKDAGPDLHDRIGAVSSRSKERGLVQNALRGDWLLKRSQDWLMGAPIDHPLDSSRGKLGGPKARLLSPSRWRLIYPVEGGVSGIARGEGVLFLVCQRRQEICQLDLATGKLATLASGFQNLRGLALDSGRGEIYAISNKYQSRPRGAPWSRGGIGQLWAINIASGARRPLTWIHWIRTIIGLSKAWESLGQDAVWKQLVGGLRWPTSVVIEDSGRFLLFTEAKAVRRIDIRKKSITTPFEIDLPFNVVGLALAGPKTLLVADAGVHPHGFGRLMRADLVNGRVEVLASGWSGIGSLSFLPSRQTALLSHVGHWPGGYAFSVAIDDPKGPPQFSWQGLNQPYQFSVGPDEEEVFVSTGDGIVRLYLR